MIKFTKKNVIFSAVFIAVGALTITGVFSLNKGKNTSVLVPAEEAAVEAVKYINANVLEAGMTASLVDVVTDGETYKFRIRIEDQEYTSYISKDGKYLFPNAYDMTADAIQPVVGDDPNQAQEVVKTDKPDVKIFVMTYCPYGLQAQKMFLPVYDLLKDEADIGIYFVDYIMHEMPEIEENLRQYCIIKEQNEKYYDYLTCFVKDGSYDDNSIFQSCLTEAKIDEGKLNSCAVATDQEYKITELYNDKSTWLSGSYPIFGIHADLNDQYGVRGSPTVVINGVEVGISSRSPEDFKNVVCEAFDSVPEECSQTLSDVAFAAGFGLAEGVSTGGECK